MNSCPGWFTSWTHVPSIFAYAYDKSLMFPTFSPQRTPRQHKQHASASRSPIKMASPVSSLTLVTDKTRLTQVSQTSFEVHHDFISVVAVLANTKRMVTSSKDKTLCLSDLTTKKVLKRLVGHSSDVSGLAVSRDGKLIASCDITGGIIPWNGKTGVCLINDHGRGAGFAKTKFTSRLESGWFTTAQNGFTAHSNESVALQIITAHQSSEVHLSLDFSADGKILASAGDRMVRFWCTTTWKEKGAFPLDAVVYCVRYSSSGERLAVATENNICIYNPATRQRIKTLKGHSGGTFALTWMPQGTYLLSGGGRHDPTIRVWDALKGDEIDAFHGHTDKINAIAVNDSSTILTSASCDGSVRFWPFPTSNILEVSAAALCVSCFSEGDDRKISQWVLPSAGLMSTKTQVKVSVSQKSYIHILTMDETAYTVCTTGGKLSTALDIFTRQIKADSNNYVCFGHRSIVYSRIRDWECALKDAVQSISIQKSLIGYMSKGIAHYGMGQIRKASIAFDLASRFAAGDSTTHHHLFLIRAIAIFNTNAHEEAIMSVSDMAEDSVDADLLACKVVQIYFYAEMALAASKGNIPDKATEYIDTAIEIANSCSLQTIDFSVYTEFVVIFGWDVKSLWYAIHIYKCLILFRTCNIEALEYYRLLVEPCNEAQKASLRAWLAQYKHIGCMSSAPKPAAMIH
ncbi:WD40-repeat-containing domain protein [Suillus americanus]|nr:WD40-repeat-containing domain protein [Suillus americanus]